jgi:hypothetical protein
MLLAKAVFYLPEIYINAIIPKEPINQENVPSITSPGHTSASHLPPCSPLSAKHFLYWAPSPPGMCKHSYYSASQHRWKRGSTRPHQHRSGFHHVPIHLREPTNNKITLHTSLKISHLKAISHHTLFQS